VKISELVRKIAMEKNREWIGWRGKVLVVDKLKSFIGRNFAYKQVVLHGATKADLGKFMDVKIVDASPTSLVGEVET
jgi:tRNA A37 methylthiotransferase MiaB